MRFWLVQSISVTCDPNRSCLTVFNFPLIVWCYFLQPLWWQVEGGALIKNKSRTVVVRHDADARLLKLFVVWDSGLIEDGSRHRDVFGSLTAKGVYLQQQS